MNLHDLINAGASGHPDGGFDMILTDEKAEKVAEITRNLLEERFGDDFVFDPIIVKARVDHYDNDYVEIQVVYDGDYDKLDIKWMLGLTRRMRPALLAMDLDDHPSHHFTEKSDWEAGPPK